MPQLTQPTFTPALVQHALVLDDGTRAALTIQHRPLNKSARIDDVGAYPKAVWTGTPTLMDFQDWVEPTWCIDHIENFAANVLRPIR